MKEEEALRRRDEARRRNGPEENKEEDGGEDGDGMSEDGEPEGLEEGSRMAEVDVDVDVGLPRLDILRMKTLTIFQDDSNPMAALLASAKARAVEYQDAAAAEDDSMDVDDSDTEWPGLASTDPTTSHTRRDTSRKAFDKIFKQVVDAADVVLYVLDARDPEGTRSKDVERAVAAAEAGSKRIVLVLNKIDLVPPAVLAAWLARLRRFLPTLPLRAANPAPNARTFDHKQLTVKGTADALLRALKAYAASSQLKRALAVGVIGYPNVGKSSVINALGARLGARNGACPTGAEAGVTTGLREVKLDSKLKLLDSPGIVFPNAAADGKRARDDEKARLVLLNAVPPREMDDPIPAVTLLLRRLSASEDLFAKLLQVYDLPPLVSREGDVTTDFLVQVARKRGRLGKGGVPNLGSAAKTVITDWRDGRIQGWVDPFAVEGGEGAGEGVEGGTAVQGDQKEIVKEWAAEFKIEGLWEGGGTQ